MANSKSKTENSKGAEKLIEESSKFLTSNLIQNSFFANDATHCMKELMEDIDMADKYSRRSRNIVIIGAGASIAVNDKIFKSGKITRDAVFEKCKLAFLLKNRRARMGATSSLNELFKKRFNELKRKSQITDKNEELTFEDSLTLLLNFVSKNDIAKTIAEFHEVKYIPSLFYELVAHFFKNRIFDVVINYNFDELLDEAIDEEISNGQFNKILSDGDCLEYKDYIKDNRLLVPLYIKPHGTQSDLQSLRYTHEHYLDLPYKIGGLLDALFSGMRSNSLVEPMNQSNFENNEVVSQFEVLNLFVFGFDMASVELNELIRKQVYRNYKSKKKHCFNIYFYSFSSNEDINHEFEKKIFGLDLYSKRAKGYYKFHLISLQEIENMQDSYLGKYNEFSSLDKAIQVLFDKISDNLKSSYKIRFPSRHILLSLLFCDLKNVSSELISNSEIFKRRLFFEIFMTVLKNKGRIQLSESLNSRNRIGKFLNLLKDQNEAGSNNIYLFLRDLGLFCESDSYDQDVFSLKFKDEEEFKISAASISEIQRIEIAKEFLRKWKKCANVNSKYINKIFDIFEESNRFSDIAFDNVSKIFHSDVVNLYPQFDKHNYNMFHSVKDEHIISTPYSLSVRFKYFFIQGNRGNIYLDAPKWNHLFLIGERGMNLIDAFNNMDDKYKRRLKEDCSVTLIIASTIASNKLKTFRLCFKSFEVYFMPFYVHSKHMSLFCRYDNSILECLRAIYYDKNGLANGINAVMFDSDHRDIKANFLKLLQIFSGSLIKSTYYNLVDLPKDIHIPYIEDHYSHISRLKIFIEDPEESRPVNQHLNEIYKTMLNTISSISGDF